MKTCDQTIIFQALTATINIRNPPGVARSRKGCIVSEAFAQTVFLCSAREKHCFCRWVEEVGGEPDFNLFARRILYTPPLPIFKLVIGQ